ncbi:hypothetical protein GCM10009525_88490 [Streptosporangium amethystogenes subsp. fukuiense]
MTEDAHEVLCFSRTPEECAKAHCPDCTSEQCRKCHTWFRAPKNHDPLKDHYEYDHD